MHLNFLMLHLIGGPMMQLCNYLKAWFNFLWFWYGKVLTSGSVVLVDDELGLAS